MIVGARRTDRLEALVAELRAEGAEVQHRALDVTQRASVEDFVGFARDRLGRLDVLVNNAGLMPSSPLAALHVEEWERMVDVNIKGVLYGIAAALPAFALGIGLGLVGQHGFERDAPVGADAAVGELALVEELDQRGSRDVEEIGALLRGDFGLDGIDRHRVAPRKLLEQIEQEYRSPGLPRL